MRSTAVSLLIEQEQLLYKKLLDCSKRQVSLFSQKELDNLPVLAERIAEEWASLIDQIESTQCELKNHLVYNNSNQHIIIEMIQEIANNIEITQSALRESELNLGTDMVIVTNQKKIMNAYYGAQFSESSSGYFDQKK